MGGTPSWLRNNLISYTLMTEFVDSGDFKGMAKGEDENIFPKGDVSEMPKISFFG